MKKKMIRVLMASLMVGLLFTTASNIYANDGVEATTIEGSADLTTVSVEINPSSVAVEKGSTHKFTANVLNATDKSVTWSLWDETDSSIDENGLLTVGINETSKALTVCVKSNEDSDKIATALVVMITKDPTTGIITYPNGTQVYPDGLVTLAGGGVVKGNDGSTPTIELGEGGHINVIFPKKGGILTFSNGEKVEVPAGAEVDEYGSIRYSDGTTRYPGGTILHPDHSVTFPNGIIVEGKNGAGTSGAFTSDGNAVIYIQQEGGIITYPNGEKIEVPDNTRINNKGTNTLITFPDGTIVNPDRTVTLPDGSVIKGKDGKYPSIGFDKDGNIIVNSPKEGGTITSPNGKVTELEGGSSVSVDGKITPPKGAAGESSKSPNGTSKNDGKSGPSTGDTTNVGMVAQMMLLAGVAVVFTVTNKRKQNNA